MGPAGGLGRLLGWLTGTGPGSGMALPLVAGGAVASGTALGGYAIPAVREVETILPGIKPAAPVGIRWTRRHGRGGARGSNYRAGLVAGGRPVELTPALGRRNLPDGRL
jgi:hypothetical protein